MSLRLRVNQAVTGQDFSQSKIIINELYEVYEEASVSNKIYVNEILSHLISSFYDYNKVVNLKDIPSRFYEKHLLDKNIKNDSNLLLDKSRYFISKGNEISKSKSYFLSALECEDIIEHIQTAMVLNDCFDNLYTENLLSKIESNKSSFVERYYYQYKHELAIRQEDYSRSLEYLEKSFSWGMPMDEYYSNLSYLCVVSGDFQKLIDLELSSRDKLEKIGSEQFKINFQYAAKNLSNNKYDPICLRNIIARTKDSTLRLAAFAVLEQDSDVKRILTEQIEVSYMNYYLYKRWPIISNEMLDDAIKIKAA